jgi:5'-nucleotidase
VTKTVTETLLANKADNNLCLNVNVPDIPYKKIKGIKMCRQGRGNWKEAYEVHKNPGGEEFLWLTGKFLNFEKGKKDTDLWALDNNYVSVVPIHADLTNYNELDKIIDWKIKEF